MEKNIRIVSADIVQRSSLLNCKISHTLHTFFEFTCISLKQIYLVYTYIEKIVCVSCRHSDVLFVNIDYILQGLPD